MIKHIKCLFLVVAFLCTGMLQAQTSDLIYHLGSSGSTINVASVDTDANGNFFVCGSAIGSSIDFNPLGTATLKSAGTGGSGFIAKYNVNGILQTVIIFGANVNNKGVKVYVDAAKQNVYLLASIYGNGVKLDPLATGFGTNGLAGSMAIAKYDNALVFKSQKIFNNATGYTGDVLNDISIFGDNLYVTGELFSTNVEFNPGGTSKKISSSASGISDIVVAKYDTTTLTNAWAYSVGGASSDGGAGIDLDNSGNIYLTGYFTGQDIDIDPIGTKTVSDASNLTLPNSSMDAFIAKYNSGMTCQWAFNIGAGLADKGTDLLVDKTSGNVFVGGIVKNDALDVDFDPSPTSSANFAGVGLNDIFVASYKSDSTYNWHAATGSTGEELLTSLAFDGGGNIVAGGYASGSVNFGNSKTITGLGGKDAFFAVFSGGSGLATGAYNLGGASDEQANGVAVASSGKILVVGSYLGAGDYNLGAVATLALSGTQDGFISRHVLCTPPSIGTQPTSIVRCEDAAASFTVVASNATSYQWKKAGSAISGATNASYSIAAVTVAQAGIYTVDVINACQTVPSNSVTLTVNPKAVITSAATSPACSGSSVGYSITSDIAASYGWTRALKTGITPSTGSGSTTPIAEILTNGTLAPINVDYIITPTATSSGCVGDPFTLTVTVNPKPSITSSATTTVCSGVALNYVITSSVPSSYNWSRALKAGITPNTGSGLTSPITETLTNSTVSPITVDYIITPTATTGGCAGSPFTLTVTVNPAVTPSVTATVSPTGAICAGTSITFTATPTNGGAAPIYQWNKGGTPIASATNATYTTTGAVNGDVYTVTLTSNATCASPTTATSTGITITVNPAVTPSVTATVSPTGAICAGTSVTFTATPTNGGAGPIYQWNKGGVAITGATNATYTTTTAANGDSYTVTLTSNATCASPATATSSAIVMTVNPVLVPAVSIAVSPTGSICAGTSITFTATPTNGGATPGYQWKKGGTNIAGATNATFTTTAAANGDVYTVTLTSNAACASPTTATSTGITITVNPTLVPSVTTVVSPTGAICAGTSITFTAAPTNGGTPTYQWRKNTTPIASATNATYTTTGAVNNDSYDVVMTSNATCASPTTATSTAIVVTVNPALVPNVATTVSPTGAICAGTSVTFTATPTNGGTTPTYQWNKNGTNIAGATNATYTTTAAANGDSYTVTLTSNATCASPTTATSTAIVMTVNPILPVSVSIATPSTTICTGTSVTFTATPTNGGAAPTYQWRKGGVNIASATNATYTTTTAANGDSYTVVLTSNAPCPSGNPATSNAIVITVTTVVTPAVSITASPAGTICTGTSVTFTAVPGNGGTAPTYQWKKNGTNIGGETNTAYTSTTLANGDQISVDMVSNSGCASTPNASSNIITMVVNANVTPAVGLTVSPTGAICAGTSITFTASPTNGGTTPIYVWKKNTVTISGATNATYTTNAAVNNDSYTVELTSSSGCASPATATSTPVVITVNPTLVPTITIATTSSTICSGDVITFTSTPTNPGSTPNYVWRKNGTAITPAATGTSYSTTGAVNGDVYSVVMTSNALCASPTSPASNNITVTVNSLPTVTGPTAVCAGSTITLVGSGTANASSPWVSSAPSVATVSNAGVVTGVAAGSVDITYTNSNGCSQTATVTVNATPNITGTLSVCLGSTTQLTGSGTAATSNAWVSATPAVATISTTGLVTSVAAGSTLITYTTNTGCSFSATVTVNALPTITGTSSLCTGSTVQLTGSATAAASNAWTSASTGVATINASGLVTGVASGTSVITYTNSNGCQTTQTITVNAVVTPTVAITANNSTICTGTSITFTATPTDGGTTPTYKWKLGSGYISGATNSTYTTTTAANGDSYSVELTSNAICTSTNTANSTPIVITVTTSVTPSVAISANPGNTICAGTLVTFTATPGNGGSAPTYQWKKGGVNISGATNATYTNSALVNGDQISVDMVSNSSCASTTNASSTAITMTVNPIVTATVTIATSANTICVGGSVTYSASYTNGGTSPLFEWFVNNISQGATASADTYTSTILSNGDIVNVKMTSSLMCVASTIVTSNSKTIAITTNVTPAVSITSDKSTICLGGSVTYTAVPVNGGTASYQWKINGADAGGATATNTFTTSGLVDGDAVSVVLTSSVTCVTSSTASSTSLTIVVASATQIASQPGSQSVCALGNNVTFSVGATGDNLTYQWKTGSTSLANNATYSGVTTKDLSISNVSNADLLGYTVTVTGTCGTLTSNVANLTQSTSSIAITTQPVAQVLETGELIQLSVTATGPTLSYQWKKNGVDLVNDSRISGANTASLQISNAQVSDSDNNYTCLIMSPCASQLSSNATVVTVSTPTSTQDALTKGFMIAPNPSAGHFTLSNNYSPFIVEELEIISMEGVVVARKIIAGTTNLSEEVYAQDLPKGMYLLVIKGEGEQAVLKIVFDK
ncbi:immunoglobulin domain-containing protein [Cytophaga aurantiaca]|uniref:immunoglobulin domain-containing protein n=1 Tax=Cytophaga aurantiaca TaxID=29530 RepID=UPI000373583E|nr:immunoglobulin domain-containing protein [Cytophaga aurantiaca]